MLQTTLNSLESCSDIFNEIWNTLAKIKKTSLFLAEWYLVKTDKNTICFSLLLISNCYQLGIHSLIVWLQFLDCVWNRCTRKLFACWTPALDSFRVGFDYLSVIFCCYLRHQGIPPGSWLRFLRGASPQSIFSPAWSPVQTFQMWNSISSAYTQTGHVTPGWLCQLENTFKVELHAQ